jgi:hypothetical protein
MIHIGNPSYYDDISNMLSGMNLLFIEGVPIHRRAELGSYTRIARLLGLATQQERLKVPENAKSINIDMPGKQFTEKMSRLPIRDKIKLLVVELFMRNISKEYAMKLRQTLKVIYEYSEDAKLKLIDPGNHWALMHRHKSKLELILENDRNEIVANNIGNYIEEYKQVKIRQDIGIIFGDAHMPYIYRELKENAYKWKLEKSIEVL